MATQTVRISKRTHEELRELARSSGESMQEIIDEAVEEYRRNKIFEQANAAYAALRNDTAAWREIEEERAAWDVTLADGLDQKGARKGAKRAKKRK